MKKTKTSFSLLVLMWFLMSSSVYGQSLNLEYEFLFKLTVLSNDPIVIGESPIGTRSIYPVRSGTFEGPELEGEVLQNGGDWLLTIDSTTSKIDARGVLETYEGDIIYIHYNGIIHQNTDGSFYFRTSPVFETGSEEYAWLNHTIAVGVGKFIEGGVTYKIYAIK